MREVTYEDRQQLWREIERAYPARWERAVEHYDGTETRAGLAIRLASRDLENERLQVEIMEHRETEAAMRHQIHELKASNARLTRAAQHHETAIPAPAAPAVTEELRGENVTVNVDDEPVSCLGLLLGSVIVWGAFWWVAMILGAR